MGFMGRLEWDRRGLGWRGLGRDRRGWSWVRKGSSQGLGRSEELGGKGRRGWSLGRRSLGRVGIGEVVGVGVGGIGVREIN